MMETRRPEAGRHLLFVAGEISGDAHAAGVMRELSADGSWSFGGLGGPQMEAITGAVENWLDEAAVLGLWEVLVKYGYFRQKMEAMVSRVLREKPDGVVMVDYPGFNLRLAKRLRQAGYAGKLIYYISPQVWAWKRGRIRTMAALLDRVICIFPFEVDLYVSSGLSAVDAGHPLVDALEELRSREIPREENLVALLPGSREREVSSLFPIMLGAARILAEKHPQLRFATIGATPPLTEKIRHMIQEAGLKSVFEVGNSSAREIMRRATVGAVASGTATLEAACLGLPYCLVYKVAWLTAIAARFLMSVRYLGIVNVIADREIVRELLQEDATQASIAAELERLLSRPEEREQLRRDLAGTVAKLGQGGAYRRAAEAIAGTWDSENKKKGGLE